MVLVAVGGKEFIRMMLEDGLVVAWLKASILKGYFWSLLNYIFVEDELKLQMNQTS
jgi:hypothetical protein